MKKVRLGDVEIELNGKLADLPWVKVSRRAAPSDGASFSSDVFYNMRNTEDMATAVRRSASKDFKVPPSA